MTNMIEKKQAAFEKSLGSVDMPKDDRDAEDRWFFEQGWAACLSALEEPSEAMVEAGVFRRPHDPPDMVIGLPLDQRRQIFRAMIKAAKGGEG